MAESSGETLAAQALREAEKLFPLPQVKPPKDCDRCLEYARRRDESEGPNRLTVVTDMQVLMKRCAAAGHR
ncbi:hypothetical protein ACIA8F_12745 [Streptomyces sp. NPDC051563]|uniref:hypothetical protein n=1 Tax=Streptomyces sp. NPDC051563 TaxID=3365659 RepID=UPI0037B319CC